MASLDKRRSHLKAVVWKIWRRKERIFNIRCYAFFQASIR